MLLHEKEEIFRELLTQTAEEFASYTEDIIEKDYYVYLLLKKIHELCPEAVFKGGTSLSKCYNVIHRFSEDIDLTFTKFFQTEKERRNIKQQVIFKTEEYYRFKIPEKEKIRSHWNVHKYNFETPVIADYSSSNMDPKVTIECSFLSPCDSPNTKMVSSFIQQFIEKKALNEKLEELSIEPLTPFDMYVQPMEITFIDKVYALCDYFIEGKVEKHSRHLYDIYMMSKVIKFDDDFKNLAKQIRNHRATLEKCYSTLPTETRTIKEIVSEYTTSEYYKMDFKNRTSMLIEEKDITYDMVIQKMNEIVATDIF